MNLKKERKHAGQLMFWGMLRYQKYVYLALMTGAEMKRKAVITSMPNHSFTGKLKRINIGITCAFFSQRCLKVLTVMFPKALSQ